MSPLRSDAEGPGRADRPSAARLAEPDLGAPRPAGRPAGGGRDAARAHLPRRRRARAGAARRPLAGAGPRGGGRRGIDLGRAPARARLEAERQACLWLDDLAALGNRPARVLAQAWVQDWIHRFGAGGGPGWQPEAAGRRAKRWSVHAAQLTQGLDRGAADRFWRTLAAHQRYLARAWPQAAERACRGSGRSPGWSGAAWCCRTRATRRRWPRWPPSPTCWWTPRAARPRGRRRIWPRC